MKNKKIYIFFLLIIVILVFILSVIFSVLNIANSNIISGVYINHINMSKKSKEKSHSILSEYIENKINSDITLEYSNEKTGKYEKALNLSILNIKYDINKSLDNAYNLGRSENIFKNNFSIIKTFFTKKNILTDISFDEKMLDTIISNISLNLPEKLIQSDYYIEDDNLIITKGSAGIIVDKDNFILNLKNYLLDFSKDQRTLQIPVIYSKPNDINLDTIHSEIYKEAKDAYFEKSPFKVHPEIKGIDFDLDKAKKLIQDNPDNKEYKITLKYTEPKIKLKNLEINVFPDKIGTFSTRYDETNKDRTTNLNLAAKKIDGTILSPGEEFSYNKIVGERSIAAGYKEAKVYQGGQIVDGLGGGICQISSTLYNSVIFANLKITQRFNHQFITSYVSAGRDATVAYGVKDFKFINNRTYPIKINVSVNSGVAKVDIYGIKEEKDYEIAIEVDTISNIPYNTKYELDPTLAKGEEKVKQKGTNGSIVVAYKVIKQNGITLSKEILSKDTYNALDRIILKSDI